MKISEKVYREISYQVSKRNKPSIFNYWEFINRRLYNRANYICSNEFYGLEYILSRYSGYNKGIKCATEHGVAYEDVSNRFETVDNNSGVLLTSSILRAKRLSGITKKIVIPVSVWTAYAKNIYSEYDIRAIKDTLGKVLVVFPQHSLASCKYVVDTERFIHYIKKIRDEYEYSTVLVCVYYWDIEHGLHICYEREGFTVVTAGRQENYDFLDNLVTILSFADAVISQGYSSAVLYAAYLGLPINIVYEDINTFGAEESERVNSMGLGKGEMGLVEAFSCYSERYSDEQRKLINEVIDPNSFKTPEEMRLLLELSRELYYLPRESFQRVTEKKKYLPIRDYIYALE